MRIAIDSRRHYKFGINCSICFSCRGYNQVGTSENRPSGVDLARDGHSGLYLIPFLVLTVLFLAVARVWKDKREVSAIVSLVAGLVSAYLINRERVRAEDILGR